MEWMGVKRLSLALAVTLTLGGLTPTALHSEEPPQRTIAFAGTPEVLRAQIQSDVMGAIEKNRSSQTLREYKESGFTPQDVYSNVKALRSPGAWFAFCQALEALQPEGIALFDIQIHHPESDRNLPCVKSLREKLQAYWASSQLRLSQHLSTRLRTKRSGSPTKLPNEERPISISKAETIIRGDLKDGEIALTFDDGPHSTRTPRLLEMFKAAGVRVNFFHVGEMIRKNGDLFRRLVKEKHTPGSHSFSHPQLPQKDLGKAAQEINEGRKAAEAAGGVSVPFFRFPYGAHSPELKEMLKAKQMPNFLWNMDSLDWKIRDVTALYDRVIAEIDKEKGGIILFHDLHEQTILVMPAVLETLRARGLTTIVFVPEP